MIDHDATANSVDWGITIYTRYACVFLHSILPIYQPMLDVYPDIIRNRVTPTAQRRLDFRLTMNENHKFLFGAT